MHHPSTYTPGTAIERWARQASADHSLRPPTLWTSQRRRTSTIGGPSALSSLSVWSFRSSPAWFWRCIMRRILRWPLKAVEHIMRDVNYGWLMRYIHANGASMFFLAVYIHMFRGLYYGSYKEPREVVWMLGVVIFLLMMATAFMGYVLPWGQMSYWGATVITQSLLSDPVDRRRYQNAPLGRLLGR